MSPDTPAYTTIHDPAHADVPHEVTVIKGRRFRQICITRVGTILHSANLQIRKLFTERVALAGC